MRKEIPVTRVVEASSANKVFWVVCAGLTVFCADSSIKKAALRETFGDEQSANFLIVRPVELMLFSGCLQVAADINRTCIGPWVNKILRPVTEKVSQKLSQLATSCFPARYQRVIPELPVSNELTGLSQWDKSWQEIVTFSSLRAAAYFASLCVGAVPMTYTLLTFVMTGDFGGSAYSAVFTVACAGSLGLYVEAMRSGCAGKVWVAEVSEDNETPWTSGQPLLGM